ncbi:MAG TPA: hypothetical protein VFU23_14715, partial [Gemmatimonadales bacterium]|nr:hypothetical protein [Gemmatimonadales bacterium]
GRLAMPGAGRHGGMGLSRMFEPDEVLVDLTARLLPGAGWVPRTQRFEIRTDDAMARGFGASRRVISRFYDPEALPRDPGALSLTTTMGYTLSAARRDSLRRFRDWHTGAGAMTDAATDEEFSRFRPAGLQPSGRPVVLIKGYNTGDFIHLNRIEGPFTGASVIVPLRDAAPGLSLRAMAGYGWSEQSVRGAAGARWSAGGWQLSGGVARTLDVTNDFRDQFDNPNFGALAGRDPWDFVERRGGGVGAARRLDRWGSLVQVELAGVEDRAVTRHLNYSLFGRRLRDNRGVTGGSYLRTRLLLDWNPAVSPSVARDGIGVRLEGENAGGDLDYTRVEGRVVVRKSLRPLFLMVRLHGGAVLADVPPPQQLFELGGPAGFPGYQYKEYAGNRAALFRTRITYPLPLLDTPIRVGRGITLPALAPAVSVGFQSGMADARSANAREAVRSLGVLRNEETGVIVTDPETGATLPASVPTGRLKSSIDIRIGVFGDALGVGVARALEKGRTSTWFVVLGRQF